MSNEPRKIVIVGPSSVDREALQAVLAAHDVPTQIMVIEPMRALAMPDVAILEPVRLTEPYWKQVQRNSHKRKAP